MYNVHRLFCLLADFALVSQKHLFVTEVTCCDLKCVWYPKTNQNSYINTRVHHKHACGTLKSHPRAWIFHFSLGWALQGPCLKYLDWGWDFLYPICVNSRWIIFLPLLMNHIDFKIVKNFILHWILSLNFETKTKLR